MNLADFVKLHGLKVTHSFKAREFNGYRSTISGFTYKSREGLLYRAAGIAMESHSESDADLVYYIRGKTISGKGKNIVVPNDLRRSQHPWESAAQYEEDSRDEVRIARKFVM